MKHKLPKRRQKGLILTYDSGDLFVTRLGYTASLLCASNEGILEYKNGSREAYELNDAEQKIVDEWMDHFDDYFEQNGWKTWEEYHDFS